MKISKRWKRLLSSGLNIVLIVGPLLFLAVYPNLPQGPSSYSESLFFSLLDGNYTTIGQAKDAYEAGEIETAKITLKQYYINRPNDTNYELVSYNLTEEMKRVDMAIQRIFTHHGKTLQLHTYPDSETIIVNGREIPNTNWNDNPYPQDDEWIWQFSRWGWIEDFARAYVGNIAIGNITQAEIYARECIDLITDFMLKEPVGSAYTWRTLDSALRLRKVLAIGETLRFSTYFSSDFCYLYLRFIADHGKFIYNFHKTKYNWAFMESKALLRACSYFPEFSPTTDWEQEVWDTLSNVVQNTFYPDGASREHALNYHVIAARDVLNCFEIADQYPHLEGPPSLKDSILNSYLFLLHNTMPDYYGTTFGDTRLKYLKNYLGQGSLFFPSNQEFSYFDSNGDSIGGTPPNLSARFRDIGVFTSRSAWNDSDALYSYFDGGVYGEFYHTHQDFGSVQFYAFGRRMLLDPGISSYTHDDYSNYFRQSYSHNVLLVNDKQQTMAKPQNTQWTSGYLGSVARASTNDYGDLWDREVIFCDFRDAKPSDTLEGTSNSSDLNRYWVVSDFWSGKNDDLTLLWQLPHANISKLDENSDVITEFPGNHNYNIRTDFSSSNIGVYGFGPWNSMDIIQNGTIEEFGQPYGTRADRTETGYYENATTLRYQGVVGEPTSWFTVHYPAEIQPEINVTRIPFTFGGNVYSGDAEGNPIGNIFTVTTSQGTDVHISLANPTGSSTLTFQYNGVDFGFEGQQCVLHFNSSNNLTQILAGNLELLSVDGLHLMEKDGNSMYIDENNTLDAITFHIDSDSSVYIGTSVIPSGLIPHWNNGVSLGPQLLEGNF
ncbi:MAG: heparinase II/III family protein [Promethearchaeota archaeon]